MKKRILAPALLALALGATAVNAQISQMAQMAPAFPTTAMPSIDQGDAFYATCQREENLNACAMYLSGYSNGVLVQTLIDKQKPRYCLPQNLTRRDQLRVVLSYMKDHLEQILEPTAAIVYKAQLASFPCR